MAKESFLRGAFILALSSGISRVLGIIYIVVLPRIILDEGMGLVQLVKPLQYFAVVIAILGMPTAVAILVAEKAAQGQTEGILRVFKISLFITLLTGLIGCVGLIVTADLVANQIIKDSGVYLSILALAPGVLFYAIGGSLRGFFQGLQYMTPTAVSQVVDQGVRIGATILLAILLLPRGIEYAAAGVAFSSVIGELCCVIVLVCFYLAQKNTLMAKVKSNRARQKANLEGRRQLTNRLLALALPIVLTTIIWPIMQMLDTFIVPNRLQAIGYSVSQVRDWMGYLGMALTLCQLPNIITVALSTSLVPAISEASISGGKRLVAYRVEEALRITILFGFPAFVGLYILAEPISLLLFNYAQVGIPLKVLAFGTVTLGTIQATTGILEGLGLVAIPVKNLLVGVTAKLILNYTLTGVPGFGILGAAWGSAIGWIVIACLNTYSVFKRVGFTIRLNDFLLKPVLASMIMGIFIYYNYDLLLTWTNNNIACIISIASGCLLYFLLLLLTGAIKEKDLQVIPKLGSPLANYLSTWGFLRK
ncbi:MAG: polysaccharide biosynthesis protein [Firmicutes bacterium]|nr:polysaccharide biosynthesis protein [Bacillota bacterium]